MSDQGLYQRHRPTTFKEVLGQPEAVNTLRKHVEAGTVPHALLLTGPSGCGKTTLARILRTELGCGNSDFVELNAALNHRGIDMVRDIQQWVGMAPMSGKVRVWLIDEVAQLTPVAQDSFLKLLEDPPGHVYFILATTDPHKLKATIITRCEEVKVKPLTPKVLEKLITQTSDAEKVMITEAVVDKIVEIADGSARKALVLLSQVMAEDDEEKQLRMLGRADSKQEAIELCRILLKGQWSDMAKFLKDSRDAKDEPEQMRYLVLGYMRTVLLGGRKQAERAARAAEVIDEFRDNFFDSKAAGLALACYRLMN